MNNQFNLDSEKLQAKKMFVYFSQLMDRPVVDNQGLSVGELYDIIVRPSEVYPQSYAMVVRKGFINRKYAVIDWSDISDIEEKEVRLKIEQTKVVFREKHDNRQELILRRDILDQQVVDTYNHKVIRVNDIHLLEVDHCLMIAHVDISLRGLIRRLGFEKITDLLVGLCNKNAAYLKNEHLISWKNIQPLSINPVSMTIKINVPQKQFIDIPAADLGEIFQDLSGQHKIAFFKSLDIKTKARIFGHIDFKTQEWLAEELEAQEVTEVLTNLPSDEATDFLEKISRPATEKFLSLMENKQSKKLSELLGYSSDSAGGLMTTEYLAFSKDSSIESVLTQIKELAFKVEPVQFVYIVDEQNHLLGATNFRRMLLANPQDAIQKTAYPKFCFVRLNSSVKEIAYLMEKYKYYVIPVVDEKNVLQGIVTVDDILSRVISIAWRRLARIKIKHPKL